LKIKLQILLNKYLYLTETLTFFFTLIIQNDLLLFFHPPKGEKETMILAKAIEMVSQPGAIKVV
jgi:hypothetical protein